MPTLAITIPDPIIRDGVEYCNPECRFYGYFCPATGKRLELVHFDGGKGSEPMQASAGRLRPDGCKGLGVKIYCFRCGAIIESGINIYDEDAFCTSCKVNHIDKMRK